MPYVILFCLVYLESVLSSVYSLFVNIFFLLSLNVLAMCLFFCVHLQCIMLVINCFPYIHFTFHKFTDIHNRQCCEKTNKVYVVMMYTAI
uniref:Uncharacterized protein n=1 Tax=Rhipicephalus microplus TaxID=6941 RepID=A0A6G5AFN1_RHIMP